MILKDEIQRAVAKVTSDLQNNSQNDSNLLLSLKDNNYLNQFKIPQSNSLISQNDLLDEIESQMWSVNNDESFLEIQSQSFLSQPKIDDHLLFSESQLQILEKQSPIGFTEIKSQLTTNTCEALNLATESSSETISVNDTQINELQVSNSQVDSSLVDSLQLSNSQLLDQTQESQVFIESQSFDKLPVIAEEPEKMESSPLSDLSTPPMPPTNTNKEILEIRKLLLKTNRMNTVTYETLIKTISCIYKKLNTLHDCENKTNFTDKNQLSSGFLGFFQMIFKCITINNAKMHEVFKLSINCYVINFKFFSKADKFQYNLLFQYIFDIIYLNSSKEKKNFQNRKESYCSRIKTHKVKTKLTVSDNPKNVQILLYYLIYLLFILIEMQKDGVNLKNRFFFEEKLSKLLSFLIMNKNTELLRLFHKNRSKLYKVE